VIQDVSGPPIMREEFELAIKEIKRDESPGIDEPNRELLKALDEKRK